MMNLLPDPLMRGLRALLCAAFVGLLAACGPGTGGTGTGPVGGVLGFSGMVSPGFGVGVSVLPPCAADCATVALQLEDERLEFRALCYRFVHQGPWDIDAKGVAEVAGALETRVQAEGGARTETQPARMRLRFSEPRADSPQVELTVLDPTGQAALLAPVTLHRNAGGPSAAPSACGHP